MLYELNLLIKLYVCIRDAYSSEMKWNKTKCAGGPLTTVWITHVVCCLHSNKLQAHTAQREQTCFLGNKKILYKCQTNAVTINTLITASFLLFIVLCTFIIRGCVSHVYGINCKEKQVLHNWIYRLFAAKLCFPPPHILFAVSDE